MTDHKEYAVSMINKMCDSQNEKIKNAGNILRTWDEKKWVRAESKYFNRKIASKFKNLRDWFEQAFCWENVDGIHFDFWDDVCFELDEEDNLCPSCRKNEKSEEPHTCPYKEDFDNDSESLCYCCDECVNKCNVD